MIKNVKKRNGDVVPFDADKLNQWATWASENCNVHWNEVIFKAIRTVHEGVSTKELQQSLIDACLSYRTEGHTKMAARLMLGEIYKEAFGDFKVPHLKDFYKKMVDAGFWTEMTYTDEELELLNDAINHDIDFGYSYATLKQFYDKYGIRAFGKIYESPQFTYMGIAMRNMENEPKDIRINEVINTYECEARNEINLPTPTIVLERTPQLVGPSCCVISGKDEAESLSIVNHIAYTMTTKGAGIGIEINTRAPKEPVKGGKIEHGGKHPYYSMYDKAVKAAKQQVRGGSATITFHCLDPEIEQLLTLKQIRTEPTYRIDTMDYSFAVNNLFLRKVARNEDWMTVSQFFAPKLWELSYSNDQVAFEEEYERQYVMNPHKKVVNARDVFAAWVRARGDNGRVYISFLDNMNSHTPFNDPIRLSNLCVAPETQILTDTGYHRIDSLVNQHVNVWNGSEWSNVEVVKTGENQKLISVITDSGQELDCTEYHKFYIFDGYWKPYKEVRAHELKVGDKLCKFDLPIIEGDKELENAYINGFYTGDGCEAREGQRVYLYNEKRKLKSEFPNMKWTIQDKYNREYCHYNNLKEKYFVPNSSFSIKSRIDWLAGYLDADGCVYRNGKTEMFVAITVNMDFAKELQLMLQTIGVDAKVRVGIDEGFKSLPKNDGSNDNGEYFCQTAYRVIIPTTESQKLLALGLECKRLKIEKRTPQRCAKKFIKIKDIQDKARYDDTYCFKEHKRGMGIFNGILTGQCQEISIVTQGYDKMEDLFKKSDDVEGEVGLCSLGAIVVSNIKDDAHYEKVAYYTAKIIDNTLENAVYPFPHIEHTAKARRSIGVGMTDLAHLMAREGLTYDSVEGRNFIHKISERHAYYMLKASVRLAKERGKCAWFHKTKYANETPWLPIDTYAKEVDTYHNEPLHYDWEGLRKEIKKYGVRFSVETAIMPNESSSVLTNTTNSIYPIRQKEMWKSSPKGMVYFRAPEMEKYEYQYAFDISDLDMVKVYSIIQKFTNQGISADFYTKLDSDETKLSMRDMLQRVIMASKSGMKTFYYENYKTKTQLQQEQDQDKEYIEDDDDSCSSCKL